MKHQGLNLYRIATNPTEKKFADAWEKKQRYENTLAYLLTTKTNEPIWDNVSERDAEVAATVIQWLGSPVGQSFLREVQDKIR